MDQVYCSKILMQHGVKPTANRMIILNALIVEENLMSLGDLAHATYPIDKSNISRTLSIFRAHHLVHVLEDGEGDTRYELCWSHSLHCEDDDQHVHFYCEKCHRTFCLEGTPVPKVGLPDGFESSSVNYMVKGLCAGCAHREALKRIH